MKMFFLLSVWLASAQVVSATSIELPEDTHLLSLSRPLTVSWVLPRSKAAWGSRMFVDPKGAPWLLCRKHFINGPYYSALFATHREIDSIAWLDDGPVLAASDNDVGTLDIGKALQGPKAAGPVEFKPLWHVPGVWTTVFSGVGPVAYLVGHSSKPRLDSLVLLRRSNQGWKRSKILAVKDVISHVAGDGETTFVVIGRSLVAGHKVVRLGKPNRKVYEDEQGLTGLEYSPKIGLFYATREGVGYIGDTYHVLFMQTPSPNIRLAGDSLYVSLRNGRGVLKLDGIEQFREIDSALAAAK